VSNLISITQSIIALENEILDNGGELTPELELSLEITEKNLIEKVDKYVYLIDRLEMGAEFFKAKQEEAAKLKKSYESTIDNLKERLKFAMKTLNTNELRGLEYCYKLAKSKPKVKIENPESLPMEFVREKISYEPDKEKIFAALESGVQIENCKLEESFSLRKSLIKN
jgi:hypothetical protein